MKILAKRLASVAIIAASAWGMWSIGLWFSLTLTVVVTFLAICYAKSTDVMDKVDPWRRQFYLYAKVQPWVAPEKLPEMIDETDGKPRDTPDAVAWFWLTIQMIAGVILPMTIAAIAAVILWPILWIDMAFIESRMRRFSD